MMIVSMVRDYHSQYAIVNNGGWNIADAVQRSYDVEGMHIGTVAAGRIGLDALRKMKPFDVHLHYFDRHRLPDNVEKELNLTFHDSVGRTSFEVSFPLRCFQQLSLPYLATRHCSRRYNRSTSGMFNPVLSY